MTRTRLLAACTCLVLLVACGSSPNASGALGIITLAADKIEQAGTARVYMEMTMEGGPEAVSMTSDGVIDMVSRRGRMTMNMDGAGSAGGLMGLDGFEIVFDGMVIYMKYPQEITSRLPGGKPWISIDLQAAGEGMGVDFNALSQAGGNDPSQTLQFLRGASGEVETVGEEEVRGVPTTHYRATIDFDKIADQAPADIRKAVESSIESMQEMAKVQSAPMDVWIDDEGFARRMTFSVDVDPREQAANAMTMTMTMEMFDFGVDVDIEIPPPSEVTDMSDFMNQSGGYPAP